jgi:NTP pyrophosphatase (non-canonical NTP hydrolase)
MDVKALQWELAAFVSERGLESRHSPKSLAMALASGSGTLLDLFKWLSEEESRQVGRKERESAAEAIAEVFLYCLRLADELGIDVEEAVATKSAKLPGKGSPEPRTGLPRVVRTEAAPEPRIEAPRLARTEAAPEPRIAAVRTVHTEAPPESDAEVPYEPRPEALPEPRAEAPPPARSEPRPPAASGQRPAKPAGTRPVPIAGPPSIRPPRSASASDFPRLRPAEVVPPRPQASPPRPAAPVPPRAAATPPRPAPAARPAPPPPPPPPPEIEPYADLDLDAVGELVKSLAKRIDAAQSEHPLVRELHDEVGTLRRTLYGKTLKRSWIGASLKNVRTMLRAARDENIGEEIKAKEHIAQVDRILAD